MRKIINSIPNLLTLANVTIGGIGIIYVLTVDATIGAYFIWVAVVFDYLDGFAARMLKATSPIGKQLDSLADMVSFGALPALIMYKMLESTSENEYVPYLGLLIMAFSALRLAKFNIDERQSTDFFGLPTPANALFISSLALSSYSFLNDGVLVGITIVFSLLLVVDVKLIAIKFKNFGWRDNKWKFIFLGVCLVIIAILKIESIPLLVITYIVYSVLINYIVDRNN